ncbi:MAG: hypothetical protein ACD_43C00190G0003 [uncultured bacterium]|nr:MAG: hypothetical protein ACD_43C00190G0003 [uncultured bacterium]
MKKALLISGVLIVLAGIIWLGYWYWQSKETAVKPLQQVALDSRDIDSFDDVCTAKDEYELECKGNIEQFGCLSYSNISPLITDLQPAYAVLICKKNPSLTEEGIYRQSKNGATLAMEIVEYIIIKDNALQLIQTKDQLREVFQPIESIEEAKSYFLLLHQGVLVFDEETLNRIKYPKALGGKERTGGHFLVPVDSISLSQVTETSDGYKLTSYSKIPAFCVDETYLYTFLLKQDGGLIEQNKQLVWEMLNKPSCIN